jgi:hypothetical protein
MWEIKNERGRDRQTDRKERVLDQTCNAGNLECIWEMREREREREKEREREREREKWSKPTVENLMISLYMIEREREKENKYC